MTGIVDSHLHIWQLDQDVPHPWLNASLGVLYKDFDEVAASKVLDEHEIAQAVLVQASDSIEETSYLLGAAKRNSWVGGVVGWIDLAAPRRAATQLVGSMESGVLKGIRHLIHDEEDAQFILRAEVEQSLEMVAEAGLALDIPDAFPRHLQQVLQLARRHPELSIVIDHLGKPPWGAPAESMELWRSDLEQAAAFPNVVAKISGLDCGPGFTVDSVEPVVDFALEVFGARRLMYGGDWPMSMANGGYQASLQIISECLSKLSADEQEQVWSGTARRIYRI
ncbi:amidohydrolase family protein [Glutamicibacter sp. Je.9.36]|uniref:amidohydrolase family protein n=1 Tax=Glutamicibacter sp. Je.9.36 TaxID=3142837 RepID=UPI003DA90D1D